MDVAASDVWLLFGLACMAAVMPPPLWEFRGT